MYDDIKMNWRDYSVHDENNIKGFFVEYRWLSNFHRCEILYENLIFPTSENAYQGAKIILEERKKFVEITAYDSKKFWREYTPIDKNSEEWDNRKYDVMYNILSYKFSHNEDLKNKLINTGDKYLEETNHWEDTYWGVDYKLGGENNLGKILMKIRSELKNEIL